jgi:hypothetical protein
MAALEALAASRCILIPPRGDNETMAQSPPTFQKEMVELCDVLKGFVIRWKRKASRLDVARSGNRPASEPDSVTTDLNWSEIEEWDL